MSFSRSAPISGAAADAAPVGVLQPRAPFHDAVGERELAMSCSRPAVWANSWSARGAPDVLGDVAREGGDGGAVARGAGVALVERADERAEHPPPTATRTRGCVRGLGDEARHVAERDDQEQDEGQRGEADVAVDAGQEDERRRC
jgi:hypothetical protein